MVQDKLWLPGLLKLKMLRDAGFFGRILSVRGEFGYWVFEGDWQPAQRPSWNYRKEDGGGIILDMLCHWRYVLDNLFGEVKAVSCLGATHIPERWDESGKPYEADRRRRRLRHLRARGRRRSRTSTRSWCVRVRRDDLLTFQVDGTHGSAVAGLQKCLSQARVNTPKPVWNPDMPQPIDFFEGWQEVPDNGTYDNAFKAQWELFLRHCCEEAPFRWTLLEGAKGVQLAEAGLQELEGAALDRRAGAQGVKGVRPCRRSIFPIADGRLARLHARGRREAFPRPSRRSAASPTRRRTSSPIRWPTNDPWLDAAIDWDATIAYRRHLWSLGLGVAEAMDTAQRGMGLDWPTSLELIRRSLDAAQGCPGALIASGAGTDHLEPSPSVTIDDVIARLRGAVRAPSRSSAAASS